MPEKSARHTGTRNGPQIGTQANAGRIEKSLGQMSGGRKPEGEASSSRGTITIEKLPTKTHGGGTKHHCPRKEHNSEARCRAAGCLAPCPDCGVWISTGYGTKCRECESREFQARLAEDQAKREEAQLKELVDKKALEEAERGKDRKKAKWGKDKKEEAALRERAAQEASQRRARARSGAADPTSPVFASLLARVIGGRVHKKGKKRERESVWERSGNRRSVVPRKWVANVDDESESDDDSEADWA